MVKNLKKHLVWIFFIFLAVIGTIFAITAQDNAGKIEISKTATKMITNDPNNNLVYGRKAKVELNVKANPYNKNIIAIAPTYTTRVRLNNKNKDKKYNR